MSRWNRAEDIRSRRRKERRRRDNGGGGRVHAGHNERFVVPPAEVNQSTNSVLWGEKLHRLEKLLGAASIGAFSTISCEKAKKKKITLAAKHACTATPACRVAVVQPRLDQLSLIFFLASFMHGFIQGKRGILCGVCMLLSGFLQSVRRRDWAAWRRP